MPRGPGLDARRTVGSSLELRAELLALLALLPQPAGDDRLGEGAHGHRVEAFGQLGAMLRARVSRGGGVAYRSGADDAAPRR